MLFKFHRPQTSTPIINLCPEQLRTVAVGTLLKLVGRSEKKKNHLKTVSFIHLSDSEVLNPTTVLNIKPENPKVS